MDSVYRFAFLSFLSFIFAVNLASTYKELTMDKITLRSEIISEIYLLLEEEIEGFHQKTSQETYDKISNIDRLVCLGFELNQKNLEHQSEI